MLELGLIILAAVAVAVADVFTKQEAVNVNSLSTALRNPLTIAIVLLYGFQIIIFSFLFVKKAELGIVGIMQITMYAIIVMASGVLFFHEKITLIHAIGVGLAILGVVLTNL